MLVAIDDRRIALLRRHRHRRRSRPQAGHSPVRRSARCWLRSANASWSARDTAKSAATFSPVSGIESMPYCCFMQRIHEAPADRRVEHLLRAREGCIGLRQHVGRAAHALDAAGDDEIGLARAHQARRDGDRVQARAAQAVHRDARHFDGQAREQRRHAREIAVVLARLVRAAEHDVVDRLPVDAGIALHERGNRHAPPGRRCARPRARRHSARSACGWRRR